MDNTQLPAAPKPRALVVYESMFGNTREVAEAVAAGLRTRLDVEVVDVEAAPTRVDEAIDLLVVGGPTALRRLRLRGLDTHGPAKSFYVGGEGPLLDGELERAEQWAAAVAAVVADGPHRAGTKAPTQQLVN